MRPQIQASENIEVIPLRRRTPSRSVWSATATAAAKVMGVDPVKVMAGTERNRNITLARWRAWRALVGSNRYSVKGIARVSGFHHATILSAMKRIQKAEADHTKRCRIIREVAGERENSGPYHRFYRDIGRDYNMSVNAVSAIWLQAVHNQRGL